LTLAGLIIEAVLWVFIGLLWIRFIVDWVQVFARSWEPHGVLLLMLEVVYSITDPPINALRRVVKPLRIGNFALDLSFILVMILAYVALYVNRSLLLA
jgi:YggT family protein